MINPFKPVRKIRRSVERSFNLSKLASEHTRTAVAVSQSLRAVLHPQPTPQEKEWISRIEHLRADLNASAESITRTDYGAGGPRAALTPEQMQAGVEVVDTVGHITRVASKSPFWCLVLFELVRHFQPKSCVEMGTAVGISGAYLGAALELNGFGTLVTLEGANSVAQIARTGFRQLGLDSVEIVVGRFQDTLTDVLSRRCPVDFVFVDGHHDQNATLSYFEELLPFLAGSALIVFDDIAWSPGMQQAWKAITSDQRIALGVDLGPVGLCVVDRSFRARRLYHIPLP